MNRTGQFKKYLFVAAMTACCGGMVIACQDPVEVVEEVASSQPVETIYFGPKFEEGRVDLYRFMAENVSIQEQGAQTMRDTTYTEYVLRVTTNTVHEDGSADFTVTYDSFYTSGDIFFGGQYEYHSEEGAGPDTDARIAAIWEDIAAVSITFSADARGEVDPASVLGTEKIVKAMEGLTATSGRMGEYNSNGLSELYESMWRVGTESMDQPVGAEWKDVVRTDVEGMGTWIFTSDYQMLSVKDHEVSLGMHMDMTLEFNPPEQAPEGQLPILESKFETLKGDFRYVWDRDKSELKERRGELEFVWLIVQEGLFEGDIVRTNQHQHVKSSLTRIDD